MCKKVVTKSVGGNYYEPMDITQITNTQKVCGTWTMEETGKGATNCTFKVTFS